MIDFFAAIGRFFVAIVAAIAAIFDLDVGPIKPNPPNNSITNEVKEGLKNAGYSWVNSSTSCEAAGINDVATCYAFSQVGYKVSDGGKPAESGGYASSSGWCCDFVKWAYSMAGKKLSDCYSGTIASSPTDGDRVTYSAPHVALVYKDSSGNLYEIDGNWGVSKGYKNTHVKLQKVTTADSNISGSPKYYKK